MNLDDQKRLFVYRSDLIDHLIFGEISIRLYEKRVLSSKDLDLIDQEKTICGQITKLLSVIVNKPDPDLLTRFCLVLKETQIDMYVWLGEAVENADISNVNFGEDELDFRYLDENTQILSQQMRRQTNQFLEEMKLVKLEIEQMRKEIDAALDKKPRQEIVDANRDGDRDVDTVDDPSSTHDTNDTKNPLNFSRRWNVQDVMKSNSLVRQYLSEFIRKPRKEFTVIESTACRLGLEISVHFLEPSSVREKLTSDLCRSVKELGKDVNKVVAAVSQLVKDGEQSHGNIIGDLVGRLNSKDINGYRTMNLMANELFKDDLEVNWGRIIAWFFFWGRFVNTLKPLEAEDPVQFVKFYGEFVGFYLAKRLHLWIAGAGGWMTLVQHNGKRSAVSKLPLEGQIIAFAVALSLSLLYQRYSP